MSQLFASLYTPKNGMYDAQKRIETVGKNISNINTEGYSRQRVVTVSGRTYNIDIAGKIENGTNSLRVMRERDTFLDSQIRRENGILGEFQSKTEILSQVETSFLEPSDNGLNKAMSDMWNSWQELSKNPSEVSVKTVVTQTTENFALTLNTVATRLEDIKENSKDIIENEVFNLNKNLEEIESLNNEIYKATIRNIEPNELLDQRDLLLDKVSKSINIDVTLDKFNRVTINAGGNELVSANPTIGNKLKFSVENFETNGIEIIDKNTNTVKATLSNDTLTGKIKGYIESFEKTEEYSTNLDNLANSIAQRVNIMHKEEGDDSTDPPSFNDTGIDFFVGANGDNKFTAKSIKINTDIVNDPSKINTDKVDGKSDGSRALAISALRNSEFLIDDSDTATLKSTYTNGSLEFTTNDTGSSFDSYYTNMISNIGIEKQSADRMVENEDALIRQLEGKKESISGVSLDEEIVNLIQFQNAYAANAKVMSTISEMLQILMNGTGL